MHESGKRMESCDHDIEGIRFTNVNFMGTKVGQSDYRVDMRANIRKRSSVPFQFHAGGGVTVTRVQVNLGVPTEKEEIENFKSISSSKFFD